MNNKVLENTKRFLRGLCIFGALTTLTGCMTPYYGSSYSHGGLNYLGGGPPPRHLNYLGGGPPPRHLNYLGGGHKPHGGGGSRPHRPPKERH